MIDVSRMWCSKSAVWRKFWTLCWWCCFFMDGITTTSPAVTAEIDPWSVFTCPRRDRRNWTFLVLVLLNDLIISIFFAAERPEKRRFWSDVTHLALLLIRDYRWPFPLAWFFCRQFVWQLAQYYCFDGENAVGSSSGTQRYVDLTGLLSVVCCWSVLRQHGVVLILVVTFWRLLVRSWFGAAPSMTGMFKYRCCVFSFAAKDRGKLVLHGCWFWCEKQT